MKIKLAILLCLTAVVITVCAKIIGPSYDKTKPAKMLLPIAYQHALDALGAKTNQFHCVSATLGDEFVSGGEWYFTFCSTNSGILPKLIAVGFNGEIIFDNGLR